MMFRGRSFAPHHRARTIPLRDGFHDVERVGTGPLPCAMTLDVHLAQRREWECSGGVFGSIIGECARSSGLSLGAVDTTWERFNHPWTFYPWTTFCPERGEHP
jgi:hypothetical protein